MTKNIVINIRSDLPLHEIMASFGNIVDEVEFLEIKYLPESLPQKSIRRKAKGPHRHRQLIYLQPDDDCSYCRIDVNASMEQNKISLHHLMTNVARQGTWRHALKIAASKQHPPDEHLFKSKDDMLAGIEAYKAVSEKHRPTSGKVINAR